MRQAIAGLVLVCAALLGTMTLASAQATDSNPDDFGPNPVESGTIGGDLEQLSGVVELSRDLVAVDDRGSLHCIARRGENLFTGVAYAPGDEFNFEGTPPPSFDNYDLEAITWIPPGGVANQLLIGWEETDTSTVSGFASIRINGDEHTLNDASDPVTVPGITRLQAIAAQAPAEAGGPPLIWVGEQASADIFRVNETTGAIIAGTRVSLSGLEELEALAFEPGDSANIWAVGRVGSNWVVRQHALSTGAQVGGDLVLAMANPQGLSFVPARANPRHLVVVGEPSEIAIYRRGETAIDGFDFQNDCRVELFPTISGGPPITASTAYQLSANQPGCTTQAAQRFEFGSPAEDGPHFVEVFDDNGEVCIYELDSVEPQLIDANTGSIWAMEPVQFRGDSRVAGRFLAPSINWSLAGSFTSVALDICMAAGDLEDTKLDFVPTSTDVTSATLTVNGNVVTEFTGDVGDDELFDALVDWSATSDWNRDGSWTNLLPTTTLPEWSGLAVTSEGVLVVDDGGAVQNVTINPSGEASASLAIDNASFTSRRADLEGLTRVGNSDVYLAVFERFGANNPEGAQTNNSGLSFFGLSNGTMNPLVEQITAIRSVYGSANHGLEGVTWARSDGNNEVFYAIKQHQTGATSSPSVLYEISVPFANGTPNGAAIIDNGVALDINGGNGVVMNPDNPNEVLVISGNTRTITVHNVDTGERTATLLTLPASPETNDMEGLAYDPNSDVLWLTGETQTIQQFTRGNDVLSPGDQVTLSGESSIGPFDVTTFVRSCGDPPITPTPTPTATPSPTPTPPPPAGCVLTSQNTETISAPAGGTIACTIDVPANATLDVTITGGDGDADLYVQYNNPPPLTQTGGPQPTPTTTFCAPWKTGSEETCTFNNPPAGTWHITVADYNNSTFTNVNLTATITSSGPTPTPSPTPTPTVTPSPTATPSPTPTPPPPAGCVLTSQNTETFSAPAGGTVACTIDVPANATLDVTITGGGGDADLYVQYNNPPPLTQTGGPQPTPTTTFCAPWIPGSQEACTFNNPPAGTWHITVADYNNSTFTNVNLTATITTGGPTPTPTPTPTPPPPAVSPCANGSTWSVPNRTGGQTDLCSFVVPAGVTTMTITMTGPPGSGTNEADLYVNRASAPTAITDGNSIINDDSPSGCTRWEDGNDALCTFANPAAGTWYILIGDFANRGYQGITVTTNW